MKLYHTYILHPGLDRTEAMIHQHLYWTGIRDVFLKEVIEYDVCQRTEHSPSKYGVLPPKLEEELPWNKLCVDLIGPYKICRKVRDRIIFKFVTMMDPVTAWFEITQYNENKSMTIKNLVETMWLVQYPWPVEIMYDQGG